MGAAILAACLKLAVMERRWLGLALYASLGWGPMPLVWMLRDVVGLEAIWLLVGGGLAYTAGAIVYGVQRPNPWPRGFGFHEVFHAFTVLGCVLHGVAIVEHVVPCHLKGGRGAFVGAREGFSGCAGRFAGAARGPAGASPDA